ncbi:hypothetical protein HYPSUDRAFT_51823 [Hypholoma sublateritium FD-334 SS-4]|uniref:Uncharacterized protein n=1 Tax=Hypholoma sublateritium (strain FD-334 SS-4) TaxID=945553 RepID=A0A0D2LJL2_HYPSF|nr:hypothetical protein HYPSUDRAFT_51823 [Hypholoma sublateritium FD-334 SS-4]
MSSFDMTVEDSSPLIAYAPAGAWIDTPNNDPLATKSTHVDQTYLGASYHITSVLGATATLAFNGLPFYPQIPLVSAQSGLGTGVSIFGGMRSNYGLYIITVDGHIIASGSAQAGNSTRQLLGTASGLSYGPHIAVLTNINGAPIDIDWIDFEAQVGASTTSAFSIAQIDNTDPTIVYSPEMTWQANTNSQFFNKTLSFTQTPGASASLNFSGGAIAVYGTISPDHADIVITVDGQTRAFPGGSLGFASTLHAQYYQSDLSLASLHLLEYSGNPQSGGPFIDLDMISIFTTGPPTDTTVTASISGTLAAESTPSPSTSWAVTADFATSNRDDWLLVFFMLRRRRQNNTTKIDKSMISVSPVLPMQKDPNASILPLQEDPQDLETGGGIRRGAFPFPVAPRKASSLRHSESIAPSYYSDPIDSHSRGASVSSMHSSTPLAPGVPRINIPQPRNLSSRKPAPSSSGLSYYDSINTPARPNTRPPTFDFTQMETPQ